MKSRQQKWNVRNRQTTRIASAEYDLKHPSISFRPTLDILEWLLSQQQEGESKASLINRKLEQLMQLDRKK